MFAPQKTTPPSHAISIEHATQLAQQHFQKGEFDACVYLCERIRKAVPAHPLATQLLGLSAHQTGQSDKAMAWLKEALVQDPQNALLLANMIEVFRHAGELDQAVAYGKQAIAIAPNSVPALANLALAHYDQNALELAKTLHQRALAIAPNHIASLNNLGSIARDEKNIATAIEHYQHVLRIQPQHIESRNNLTTVLIEEDRLDDALAEVDHVLKCTPTDPEALRNLGRIHLMRLDLDAAERCFRQALTHDAALTTAHLGLSQVFLEKNHPDLAMQAAKQALELEPENPACLHQMGLIHSTYSDSDAAMSYYEQALEMDTGYAPSLMGKGHLHLELGNQIEARAAFETAARRDRNDISAIVALSRTAKPRDAADPVFQALERALPRADRMSPSKQIAFRFGLADCYDAVGNFDAAWTQYQAGAALKRSTIEYDADARDRQVDDIIKTFTPEFIEHLRPYANSSAAPIFVLGMPRSGTTLTETILAGHSNVFGAGELNDLRAGFETMPSGQVTSFPSLIRQFAPETLRQIVDRYVATLDRLSGNAKRVTDKMPSNFDMIGLIHALLPNARIVHVSRDGMESCFSGFTRLFERSQFHSYDQVEMARYYNGYLRLMAHWAQVLPATAIHTVDYQTLVTDRETVVRNLLDHCGLSWEGSCMQPHQTNRRVRTASITQVRQPIYTSSIGKWRSYESHLGKMMAELAGSD